MERAIVIGTAGHIDHGKTTLVRALTGVDTDRLAEEKARGITIDLGFAPLAIGDVRAGIVDVPGHEGFIRNMVAGAAGVDLALLVIAADEGVMPQTREHLAILRYLGVRRGIVVLAKSDLAADAAWRDMVAEDARSLVKAEMGEEWPVAFVSAHTGDGLDMLRDLIVREAATTAARSDDDLLRMPVDRVFALPGAGTVVTGTLWSGVVKEGDLVTVLPLNREARVRSIQVHGAPAVRSGPGRRTALALVGLDRSDAARGAVIVSGDAWRATRAIDASVHVIPGVQLRVRDRLRLHHGTAEVVARVAGIGKLPGRDEAVALRLRLDDPIVARAGDHFVLRRLSPVTTIGGGVITDPWAERRGREKRRRLLTVLDETPAQLVARLVESRGASGMTRAELAVAAGLNVARLTAAVAGARKIGVTEHDDWLVAAAEVDAAARRMKEALEAFHAAQPLEPGMSVQAWRAAAHAGHDGLAALATAVLESKNTVRRDGALVRRSTHNPNASAEALATQDRLLGIVRQTGAEPKTADELAADLPGADVSAHLRALGRNGTVVQVGGRWYAAEVLQSEKARLEAILKDLGPATPSAIKERMGRSRKWLIPLLEWTDREGVTVRTGDVRALRNMQNA